MIRELLRRHGHTYADEAGIRLADQPTPLYQLLVLATLLSARIRAGVALAAARQLFTAGYRSPQAMDAASWQDRVDALGRGHYRRYDERTSKLLGDSARLCLQRWKGDLRRLHAQAPGEVARLRALLVEFPGIGPTGADIFLREAQLVWPDIRPYLDRKVSAGAQRLRLSGQPDSLVSLVDRNDVPRLAAALVRMSLDPKAAAELTGRAV
jgi:endonuclease III